MITTSCPRRVHQTATKVGDPCEKREDFRVRITQTLPRPATAVSVVGHAMFVALLAIEAPRHIAVARPPAAVDVVILAPSEGPPPPPRAAASRAVAEPTPVAPAQTESPNRSSPLPAQTARSAPGARVTATEYFASAVLDDPRNRKTRQKLATLSSDERLIQLCNIEAMEQLKRWKAGFVPDHVVAYATADPSMNATSLEASGAAVHSVGKWYRLSFSCTSTTGLERVASFAFTLGRPIPQEEWEQDNLPEQVDGDATD